MSARSLRVLILKARNGLHPTRLELELAAALEREIERSSFWRDTPLRRAAVVLGICIIVVYAFSDTPLFGFLAGALK